MNVLPEYLRRLAAALKGFSILGSGWLAPCAGYLLHPLTRRILPGRKLTLSGFQARVGTDDFFVLGQLFREYDIDDVRRALATCDLVIDAGANVGAFSWLVRRLSSRISLVAIEPEAANFASLSRQPQLRGIAFLNAALSVDSRPVFLVVSGNSATHHTTDDPSLGTHVPATTIEDVAGKARRVFLKLDIEGAEKAILEKGIPENVGSIVMEWHHSSPPPALPGGDWAHRGENSYGWHRDFHEPESSPSPSQACR